jgi:hypothetical protein
VLAERLAVESPKSARGTSNRHAQASATASGSLEAGHACPGSPAACRTGWHSVNRPGTRAVATAGAGCLPPDARRPRRLPTARAAFFLDRARLAARSRRTWGGTRSHVGRLLERTARPGGLDLLRELLRHRLRHAARPCGLDFADAFGLRCASLAFWSGVLRHGPASSRHQRGGAAPLSLGHATRWWIAGRHPAGETLPRAPRHPLVRLRGPARPPARRSHRRHLPGRQPRAGRRALDGAR